MDTERIKALKAQALSVLTGKNLKAECSHRNILDLGHRQPDNKGWVARYEAEFNRYLDRTVGPASRKDLISRIKELGSPPSRSCWEGDKKCLKRREVYFNRLHKLNNKLVKLEAPARDGDEHKGVFARLKKILRQFSPSAPGASASKKELARISNILGRPSPVHPGASASEVEKRKYREKEQRHDNAVKKALRELMQFGAS